MRHFSILLDHKFKFNLTLSKKDNTYTLREYIEIKSDYIKQIVIEYGRDYVCFIILGKDGKVLSTQEDPLPYLRTLLKTVRPNSHKVADSIFFEPDPRQMTVDFIDLPNPLKKSFNLEINFYKKFLAFLSYIYRLLFIDLKNTAIEEKAQFFFFEYKKTMPNELKINFDSFKEFIYLKIFEEEEDMLNNLNDPLKSTKETSLLLEEEQNISEQAQEEIPLLNSNSDDLSKDSFKHIDKLIEISQSDFLPQEFFKRNKISAEPDCCLIL